MVYHVYNLVYCEMMTMAICDMQSKDTEVQQIMWTKFNETMLKHKFPKSNFKGCMANITQANCNIIRFFYGYWDLLSKWLIMNAPIHSIGLGHSISTPKN